MTHSGMRGFRGIPTQRYPIVTCCQLSSSQARRWALGPRLASVFCPQRARRPTQALAASPRQPAKATGHRINKDHQDILHVGPVHRPQPIGILSLPVRCRRRLIASSRVRPAPVHPDLASSLTCVLCSRLRAPPRQAWGSYARRRPPGGGKAVSSMSVTRARPTLRLL